MRDKINGIITAIKILQIETDTNSVKDKLYWVDHYLENATTELHKALKTLKGDTNA